MAAGPRRGARLLPALGLVVALAGGWWAWSAGLFTTRGAPGRPGEAGVPTIAVLPIEIISERPEDRAFAEAMHVQLIDELPGIRPLVVLEVRPWSAPAQLPTAQPAGP